MMGMDIFDINNNAFAAAANGLLLWLSVILLFVMVNYIRTKVGVRDIMGRLVKSTDYTFQGGVYDVAIAMATIALGLVIRTETTWEFRVFPTEIRPMQMVVGSTIIAAGVLCMVRLLAPHNRFGCYFWAALVSATIFTITTYYIADFNWPEVD